MVRNYVPKSKKYSLNDEDLKIIQEKIKGGQSVKCIASESGIPETTLRRKLSVQEIVDLSLNALNEPPPQDVQNENTP